MLLAWIDIEQIKFVVFAIYLREYPVKWLFKICVGRTGNHICPMLGAKILIQT